VKREVVTAKDAYAKSVNKEDFMKKLGEIGVLLDTKKLS
jgi:hypothetical protein